MENEINFDEAFQTTPEGGMHDDGTSGNGGIL